jgi:hypothetical protein
VKVKAETGKLKLEGKSSGVKRKQMDETGDCDSGSNSNLEDNPVCQLTFLKLETNVCSIEIS